METDHRNFTPLDTHVLGRGNSVPKVFESDFDYELARLMSHQTYGGAEAAECLAAARRIVDGDVESWTKTWTELAQRVEGLAEEYLAKGHIVSAREAYLRATTYYECAFFYVPAAEMSRRLPLFERHRDCFRAAGALFEPAYEMVEIPFEDSFLPGYFLRPDKSGTPRPTVLIQGGGDTTSEQLYFSGGGAAALRRGYNALLFDGPGQWGDWFIHPERTYRYDWEVPVSAVVDYAVGRPDVDASRLALMGYSFGGYFVIRAACFEHRIAAFVALPIVSDTWPETSKIVQVLASEADIAATAKLLVEDFFVRHGVHPGPDLFERAAEHFGRFNLNGMADKIRGHVLNISTSGEGPIMLDKAVSFYEQLTCPKSFVGTTEEDAAELHCIANNLSLLHAIEFDWLDEVFGLVP